MKSIAIAALVVGAPLAAGPPAAEPTLTIVDPTSLSNVISFAPPPPQLARFGPSKVLWRVDVGLPVHAAVRRIRMTGYAPIVLELDDGRCFGVGFNGASDRLVKASIARTACEPEGPAKAPPAPPRPRLVAIGKAWNLDAWRDPRSGRTTLVPDHGPDAQPVLTTSMRVVAVGGLGAPDAPMTEVSLAGYIHGRLVLTTAMLTLP